MENSPDIWKRIKSEEVADCRIFKIRKDLCERQSDNSTGDFFVLENPDWVNIIALTKENEVVLIEQFRHGTEEIILEIPGGLIDINEEAEIAAKRELVEETGYEPKELIYLGFSHPNPAIQSNTIHHFLANDCEKTSETKFDEHESINTKLVSLDDIEKLVLDGTITHSLAITGFYYLSAYKNKHL